MAQIAFDPLLLLLVHFQLSETPLRVTDFGRKLLKLTTQRVAVGLKRLLLLQ